MVHPFHGQHRRIRKQTERILYQDQPEIAYQIGIRSKRSNVVYAKGYNFHKSATFVYHRLHWQLRTTSVTLDKRL